MTLQEKADTDIGAQWEKSVFGVAASDFRQPGKMPFDAAVQNAMSLQQTRGWYPCSPGTRMGKEIFECVKSYLPPDQEKILEFYCAIGTALDFYHSIDGFFQLACRRVPIDLTVSRPPENGSRVIFVVMRECNGYLLWRTCRKIAVALSDNFR